MKLRLSMLAALILVLLVGCAPATPEPTNTPEPTEEPEPTEAPDPTATPEPDPTIVDVATQAGDFETLLLAAEAAGLAATLTEEGPFTIFAPTDEAFQATLEDRALTVGDLTADLALLNEVLLYHVVEGTVSAEDLTGMETVTTLQGEEITVEVDDGEVILNGSVIVVDTDIEASNGIIHVVDGVLVPPTADTVLRPNIPQLAQNVEGFSTLVAAVEAAGLLETLGGTGPFTVFAPTDDAFADALGTLGLTAEDLLGDTELLEQILLYHVVDGAVTASDLIEDGATLVPTAQGDLLQTNLVTGDVVLNGAITVEAADLLASNGIVHVIDGVLLPPGFDYETDAEANLVDVASEAGTFETLLAAAEAAGLVDVLTGDTTFTVFAPTDTAFNTTLGSLGLTVDDLTANPDLLAEILSYHLLIGAVDSEAVAAAERFITVDGEPLAVEDIPLTDQLDIEASNGIIHVIDGVLVPPSVSATGALTAPFSTAALSSYDTGGELFEGAAEIAAYDAATQTIFLLRGDLGSIERLDISDPTNPTSLGIIELGGGPNSVAASGGVIAVAVEGEEVDSPGFVVFLDGEGNELNRLTVGVLPDMVAISPDGNLVVTANEGEPSDDYSIDPEGSVSVIDISGGVEAATQDNVTNISFEGVEVPEDVRVFGPDATFAQDAEPEYVAISSDSTTAFVALQENNALAVVDLVASEVTAVVPLGFKDYFLEENAIDASNRDGGINIQPWPVFGMYQPDAIDLFSVGGQDFIISANEGDARDYDTFSEEARVADLTLDAEAFADALDQLGLTLEELQDDSNLGRLNITTTLGDTDGDGEYEELYAYGARSFTIWNTSGEIVFDSANLIETLTAQISPNTFNSNGTYLDFDSRSDDKGAEPEGVVVGTINGTPYGFVGLERFNGVMVFDLSDPTAPVYVAYLANFNPLEDPADAGDLSPEGLLFIDAADSPTGTPLLVVANEVSGTVTFFDLGPR